jgi:hypothetical protein
MTEERLIYLAIKDEIDQLPQQDKDQIYAAANDIKATVDRHGGHGVMAVAFVGAEFAATE